MAAAKLLLLTVFENDADWPDVGRASSTDFLSSGIAASAASLLYEADRDKLGFLSPGFPLSLVLPLSFDRLVLYKFFPFFACAFLERAFFACSKFFHLFCLSFNLVSSCSGNTLGVSGERLGGPTAYFSCMAAQSSGRYLRSNRGIRLQA